MLKEGIMECIEHAYSLAKKVIQMDHENKMSQIRLLSANKRKIEESKQMSIEGRDEKLRLQRKQEREDGAR